MKAFITSQFIYCPLVLMCRIRSLKSKINKFYERALRLVYDDRQSTFEELLNIVKSTTEFFKCLLQNCIKYIMD